MWDKIAGFFEGVLDFFEAVWGMIASGLGSMFEWIGEAFGAAFEWLFVDVIWGSVQGTINQIEALPFNSLLAQLNFGEVAIGSFMTHFVDVNLVIATLATCVAFLAQFALVKFILKLVPSIG